MALTVVGRYQIPGNLQLYAGAQDPNDADSIYFIGKPDSDWRLYKFTWPSTLTIVANIGTAPTGKIVSHGLIANGNFAYGLGYLSLDRYYGIYVQTQYADPDDGQFIEVNLEDGSVTTRASGFGAGAAFQPFVYRSRIRLGYDGAGTYFYMANGGGGNAGNLAKKYVGKTTGASYKQAINAIPYVEEDDQSYIGGVTSAFKRVSTVGGSEATIANNSLPVLADVNAQFTDKTYTNVSWSDDYVPHISRFWDDNWRYFFITATITGGGHDLIAVRKNVATAQWQMCRVDDTKGFVSVSGWPVAAFDVWKENDLEKYWFSYGGQDEFVFASVWPFVDTNNVAVDDTNGHISSMHTNEEFCYVYHYGGGTWASCVTKVQDSDLIATTTTPSISATGAKVLWKDKRVYFIKVPNYGRYLWWTAPFEPEALDPAWDGYNTTVFEEQDNTALMDLEDSVYIGSTRGWKRLRGKTPDIWILDKSLATIGPLTDKTVAVTSLGAIYPRADGLHLFNGYSSMYFTEQIKNILANVNWDEIDKAFSLWDGRYFRFFYPSGSATINDRELIVDLILGLQLARVTEGDRAASAGWYDFSTQTLYLGTETGEVMTVGTSGSRSLSLTSKEFPAANLMEAGAFSALHYDLDNQNEPVYITPVYDGVDQATVTIPASASRKRSSVSLPRGNAYRVGIKIAVTTSKDMRFYEPWFLE